MCDVSALISHMCELLVQILLICDDLVTFFARLENRTHSSHVGGVGTNSSHVRGGRTKSSHERGICTHSSGARFILRTRKRNMNKYFTPPPPPPKNRSQVRRLFMNSFTCLQLCTCMRSWYQFFTPEKKSHWFFTCVTNTYQLFTRQIFFITI